MLNAVKFAIFNFFNLFKRFTKKKNEVVSQTIEPLENIKPKPEKSVEIDPRILKIKDVFCFELTGSFWIPDAQFKSGEELMKFLAEIATNMRIVDRQKTGRAASELKVTFSCFLAGRAAMVETSFVFLEFDGQRFATCQTLTERVRMKDLDKVLKAVLN